ncbi:MAG: hypothetical protein R3C14_41715 [Caldilineaceae bacterium]
MTRQLPSLLTPTHRLPSKSLPQRILIWITALFDHSWRSLHRSGLFVPLTFAVIMLWRRPFTDAGDFDYDEGINLMKSLLYTLGYRLYADIWNDQPPLLTALLSWWFRGVGASVAAARVLIALFSAALLWSFYLVLRRSVTLFAAAVAVTLLMLSEYYLRLSGAVMIGLPALALAMVAVTLLLQGDGRKWSLIASALVMAAACQTKLFVAALFPAFALYFLAEGATGAGAPTWRQRLRHMTSWFAIVAVAFLAQGLYFQSLNVDLLVNSHLTAQASNQATAVADGINFFTNFYQQHGVYLVIALIGIIYALRQRQRAVLFPLAWFLTAVVGLALHRPLWYHHVLLLTIPLCWLCAFGVEAWVQFLLKLIAQQPWYTAPARVTLLATSAAAVIAALLLLPSPLFTRLSEQASIYRPLYVWEVVQQLQEDEKQHPGFVFTDRPFYAFKAELPVTPAMTVISSKRFKSGLITEETMLDAFTEYKPEYVILQRFTNDYGDAVMGEIDSDYELVLEIGPARYYQRHEEKKNSLLDDAS